MTYGQKLKVLRAARNKLRAQAKALNRKMLQHNNRVRRSFPIGEIDSWKRGSLMLGLEVF